MSETTLPKHVKSTITLIKMCPFCKSQDIQDKRYKRKAVGFSCMIRRWSAQTIVQECRECGLRFSISWKSLRNALKIKSEKTEDEDQKRLYEYGSNILDSWIECEGDIKVFNKWINSLTVDKV